MGEKALKYLYDIKYSIDEINSFFLNNKKTFENYSNNILLKRAVERNLEIIGEAMSKLLKTDPEISVHNAKRIIGLRNQIIHGYDSVSDENIWAIVISHLPKLKEEIDDLIEKNQ
ncbi:MAG: hypothetical protein A2W91_18665 [Bacteroidetes bacterium GWF2_38_335]|nr:MAG: hypothetical protein A2W91_18665 [Bacteroidetes bacterium GWF2_38_335]OFY78173.1 MAG: hypothetical protein A2281_04400 [Bacteroidetes bacterium RIFOXYA12_FULL_38_20]HBS88665.1 hypothetical protein [Bacteroidales bacterium]